MCAAGMITTPGMLRGDKAPVGHRAADGESCFSRHLPEVELQAVGSLPLGCWGLLTGRPAAQEGRGAGGSVVEDPSPSARAQPGAWHPAGCRGWGRGCPVSPQRSWLHTHTLEQHTAVTF